MSLNLRRMDETKPDRGQIGWLWPAYLAAGKLTIMDGDPGTGKSMIAIDIAARLSRGGSLPDGETSNGVCKTLLLNAEDDPDDTLMPRLEAAGADRTQVFVAGGRASDWQFPRDLADLEGLVAASGIGLVVIDPLPAFLPPNLAFANQNTTRLVLAPLEELAARTGAAILIVRHLTKRQSDRAIRRGLGSMSILGLARTGLIVGRHPRDPEVGLLAITKSNLAAVPAPLGFRLTTRDGSPVIEWTGRIEGTAEFACANPARTESPGILRATVWLLQALANGERPAVELLAAAKADGIAERTLDRAKRSLGIQSKFTCIPGKPRNWLWCPPKENKSPSVLDPLPYLEHLMEDPIRSALPNSMSKETSEILDRERFEWALKNLRKG